MIEGSSLGAVLRGREDPMAACELSPWLTEFLPTPVDAAEPLAMSGPHPRAVGSYGRECIAWARDELGIEPRWWQALAITRQLEHDQEGELVYRELVESGPRRIGKSVRLRLTALWRLHRGIGFGESQLAMLVSKDLAVGKEIHRGAWRWADRAGWGVTRLNGAQEIESPAGDRWLLRAPNAAYGYDVGYGQVDESWGVDPMAITDGLEPALLERRSPQLHLTSTAHVKASSLMRRRLVAALRDSDPDVLLLLWGARPDADFSLEETWRAASPHWTQQRRDLVRRKYAAALAGVNEPEFDDPDPVRGWASQYLNVWPGLLTAGEYRLIDPDLWRGARDRSAIEPETACVFVDVAPDREYASIGVAANYDGRTLLLVKHGRGMAWVVPELVAITGEHEVLEIGLAPHTQARALIPDIEAEGFEVKQVSLAETGAACAAFQDGVRRGRFVHVGQAELDAAVENAKTRRNGEVEVWDRREWAVDISPLVAVSNAAHRWSILRESDYDLLDSVLG